MIRKQYIINLLMIYLLLFLSGSWRYQLSADHYLVMSFPVTVGVWFLYTDRKISETFVLYTVVFFGFLFALHLYTGGGISLPSVIASTLKLVTAYLILEIVSIRFSEVYLKLLVFLAFISLFGYLSDKYNLWDGLVRKLPPVGDIGYEGIFYLFRFSWHIDRNNSIFFEPGAYQGFLNAALFLLFFTRTDISKWRKRSYAAILMIALITTFSTAGFAIFLVMTPLLLYRSEILTFSGKIAVLGTALVVISMFSGAFYSSFVTKIHEYLTAEETAVGSSAVSRSSSAQADIALFKKHVFGIGFDKYYREFARQWRDPKGLEGGSSNGVTKTLVTHGLPFSLFLFGSYYWGLKKLLKDTLLTVTAYIMFMMLLWSESYYVLQPISLSIISAAFVFNRLSVKERLIHEAA